MGFIPIPVTLNEAHPARGLVGSFAVETVRHSGRIHRPVGLRKLRQATDSYPASSAEKTPHPDQQNQDRRRRDVALIVSQRLQGVCLPAIRAVIWGPDLLVILLLGILFRGQ